MKFVIFLKSSLHFNKNFTAQQLKTRTAINAKTSVFLTCVEAILYLLSHNLHDCTLVLSDKFLINENLLNMRSLM